ncbi:SHOCT domain-containing protein [uncultured Cellulomonas sp.]|uniref:SHOCT domain-containing protein n=1 Tax=uncultured Cellulomonas sp. TaxID=189682 RepID=UPI0028E59F4A|nr:SHOCT domain-containing protein [uncultured Cellulomonas sp.]
MSTDDAPRDEKAPLDERLRRLGIAHEVQRLVAAGIDKLPVSDPTKTSLTAKSATAVVAVGETGVALAKGAATAAKDGAEAFQRTRHEYAGHTPAASPDADVTTRLERLSELHRDGHLDDVEYAAAKAKVLAGS